MQNKESAERFSCALPVAFRDDYCTAIRQKNDIDAAGTETGASISTARKKPSMCCNYYQSCCVFGCWNDAQIFLERMEMEGRNIEYCMMPSRNSMMPLNLRFEIILLLPVD